VKAVERLNIEDAMEEARADASKSGNRESGKAKTRIPIVAHRRSFCAWLVTMEAETFFRFLRGDFAGPGGRPPGGVLADGHQNKENFGDAVERIPRRKRVELMALLGNVCAHCGTDENLEFDCISPKGHRHHRGDASQRMCFYRRQFREGNPTRNSKKLSKAAWILRLAFIVRFAFSSLERSFLRVRRQWG
jgi:hypothetical protein